MIYADNAATTRLDEEALEAMMPFFRQEYANASQPYSFSRNAKKALATARESIAKCIGANPEEIIFTSGGTESDNWALKGIFLKRKDDSALVTSAVEHHAILKSASMLQRLGYTTYYLPVDSKCCVNVDSLSHTINDRVKLVSIMMANNEVGSIQPIKELAEVAHRHDALFHTDAVQAVGHIDIDVHDLDVDLLSASAHKFNGPKGVGFLYVKNGVDISPYADGGSQERSLRAGTENVALCVGMAVALKKACDRIDCTRKYLIDLENRLVNTLQSAGLDFLRNGSQNRIPGNISLSFRNAIGEMLLHRLDLMGICISTGSACDSKNQKATHVIEAMMVPSDYALGTIRISLGHENTSHDVDKIANSLIRILSSTGMTVMQSTN